jgi:hypothetical protein
MFSTLQLGTVAVVSSLLLACSVEGLPRPRALLTAGDVDGGDGDAGEADAGVTEDRERVAQPGRTPVRPDFSRQTEFGDLQVQASGVAVDRRMQFRVIHVASNTLIGIGLAERSPAADFEFILPHTMPAGDAGDFRLDIWSDLDDDGGYDKPPVDEAWRVSIRRFEPSVVRFAHDENYSDITDVNAGEGLELRATEMGDYTGANIEIRASEVGNGRVVWRYLGKVPGREIGVTVSHVFYDGIEYRVEVAIDANRNGEYDGPPTDPSWRFTERVRSADLKIAFDNDAAYQRVDFR